MRSSFVFRLFGFIVLLVHATFTDAQTLPEQHLGKLDDTVEKFMKEHKIMGGTVALVKDEKLIYSKAFGVDKNREAVSNATLFKIASLSKPITAIAIMKLAEQKKIHLEQKVFGKKGILNDARFLKIEDCRIYNITVKHLLEHTAGWDRDKSSYGDPMFHPFHIARELGKTGPADKQDIIEFMVSKQLDFTPGEKFAYSNLGYNILGRVIEKVTGLSYEAYIRQAVLKPAGIEDMQLAGNDEYSSGGNRDNNFINIAAMDAHGGWKATAEDMARLLVAIDPKHYGMILSKNSVKTMLHGSSSNDNYAMGWFVNAKGNFWHTGSLDGCSSFMARLHNGICAVVLFNDRSDDVNYFVQMDKLVWDGISGVKEWPNQDLFQKNYVAQVHAKEVRKSFFHLH